MANYLHYLAMLVAMLVMIPASGCVSLQTLPEAGPTVQAHDLVALSYSCFLEDGSLAATTEAGVAEDQALVKAPQFRPRPQYGPLCLSASDVARPEAARHDQTHGDAIQSFENVVEQRLAGSLTGLAYGAPHTIRLAAEIDDTLPHEARFLERKRILHPMKTVKVMRNRVAAKLGKEPAPGMMMEENGSHFLEVVAVDNDTVIFQRLLQDGMTFMTPYGPARVKDDHADHFTLIFDIRENMVVRTGSWVGRITGVTDDTFLIDYGHPFGYAVLDCRVSVEPGKTADALAAPLAWRAGDERGTEQTCGNE